MSSNSAIVAVKSEINELLPELWRLVAVRLVEDLLAVKGNWNYESGEGIKLPWKHRAQVSEPLKVDLEETELPWPIEPDEFQDIVLVDIVYSGDLTPGYLLRTYHLPALQRLGALAQSVPEVRPVVARFARAIYFSAWRYIRCNSLNADAEQVQRALKTATARENAKLSWDWYHDRLLEYTLDKYVM